MLQYENFSDICRHNFQFEITLYNSNEVANILKHAFNFFKYVDASLMIISLT